MGSALTDSITLVGYFALFAGTGVLFVFVNLLIGRFFRPSDPHAEKLEIYECGEPAIGSSFVQFDLRFYVVALIFIVFDVEVAFLYPWATVFGKAQHLAQTAEMTGEGVAVVQQQVMTEMGVPAGAAVGDLAAGGQLLFGLAVVEVLVFFLILLIAFAYIWRMGALDWVRALTAERRHMPRSTTVESAGPKSVSVLSA